MNQWTLLVILLLIATAGAGGAQAMSFLPGWLKKEALEAEATTARDEAVLVADKVLVRKSERMLYLLSRDEPFRSYPVSLGSNPVGHKEREGDGRTPEGLYFLDWRNPESRFHKSLHVSYPNTEDRLRARRMGVDPGGMIMIHGQPRPNRHADLQQALRGEDWTQGCIAVSNAAIEEIWSYTRNGIPIEILP